jgi:hypothetical protein
MCSYFIECDGDLENDSYSATAFFESGMEDVGVESFWELSNYVIQPSGSRDCDGHDPDGTVWNYTDDYVVTPYFWVAQTGNTSSSRAGSLKQLN